MLTAVVMVRRALRAIAPFRCAFIAMTFATIAVIPDRAAASPAGRDWEKNPTIVEMDTTEDVFAIGDVHGDYERLVTVLLASGLILERPEKPQWVKWDRGKAILVCTGDLIDKGSRSLDVLLLFRALQADATKSGGRVIVTPTQLPRAA